MSGHTIWVLPLIARPLRSASLNVDARMSCKARAEMGPHLGIGLKRTMSALGH